MFSLYTIDLSYNSLECPLPNGRVFEQASIDAFMNNKDLCGKMKVSVGGFGFSKWRLKRFNIINSQVSSEDRLLECNYDGRIVYKDIIDASENFDDKYCIAVAGYGTVYKAQLQNGQVLAVKKFHRSEDGSYFDQEFKNEIKTVTNYLTPEHC
ncbi:MDIS1-interacting receptor like kinase 2-like [Elaeis guineensis]|uniref:MDIS1-interacting receptor like kinase 2-like n=1 Tax=Elaeis guineensis var. tenera TaxID=51953 RepID=UPI003C6D0F36